MFALTSDAFYVPRGQKKVAGGATTGPFITITRSAPEVREKVCLPLVEGFSDQATASAKPCSDGT
jgi:hypothetical protein